MTIIEIEKHDNGSHNNQTIYGVDPFTFPVPEGWAIFPDEMERENFPFGDVTVEDKEYVSDKFFVPKADPEPVSADGDAENETGGETPKEPEMKPLTVTVPTVTSWAPSMIPDPGPAPAPEPSQLDRVEAQSTYTAMMTNTLLTV